MIPKSIIKMNVGFFVRHFTERGTEVAIYDYAKHNEEMLHNTSYIICFSQKKQKEIGFPEMRHSYEKFNNRFHIIELNDISDMRTVINDYKLSFFYTLTHGDNDIYDFNNKSIWNNCKTIKHCVFNTSFPEGDFYISISGFLNKKFSTNIPVIPHMVDLPDCNENLRDELRISKDSTVIGLHNGNTFTVHMAKQAIIEYLQLNPNTYFIFMNVSTFYDHPKIIYLNMNVDLIYKTKFINTCDAMIHGRHDGETFGLSIAEFSIKNKPVITCRSGDLAHIDLLKDTAIIYNSVNELVEIFKNINTIIKSRTDWDNNLYKKCTPEHVMNLFKTLIFDK